MQASGITAFYEIISTSSFRPPAFAGAGSVITKCRNLIKLALWDSRLRGN